MNNELLLHWSVITTHYTVKGSKMLLNVTRVPLVTYLRQEITCSYDVKNSRLSLHPYQNVALLISITNSLLKYNALAIQRRRLSKKKMFTFRESLTECVYRFLLFHQMRVKSDSGGHRLVAAFVVFKIYITCGMRQKKTTTS